MRVLGALHLFKFQISINEILNTDIDWLDDILEAESFREGVKAQQKKSD